MIYLDHAATSWPKPAAVVRAVRRAMTSGAGNAGRTGHAVAQEAALTIQECRENLAQLFGIANPLRICFTSNTTDALNIAIKGALRPGDHAICTSMEHNSVWRPLVALKQQGIELTVVEAEHDGVVEAGAVERAMRTNTRLIAMIHASNVNGAVQPIAKVGALARARGVWLLVDAAQSAGVVPIDVREMQIDLLAFPGHKGLLGPQGTGGLFVDERVELRTIKEGGTGSQSHSPYQPAYYPDRLESGTLNFPGIAGLNASVRFLLKKGVDKIAQHERALADRLIDGLAAIDGVTLYCPSVEVPRVAVVSFNLHDLDPMFVASELERRADIACRPGWHCAGLAHKTLGTAETGTVRFSPGPSTGMHEIETTLDAVAALARTTARLERANLSGGKTIVGNSTFNGFAAIPSDARDGEDIEGRNIGFDIEQGGAVEHIGIGNEYPVSFNAKKPDR
jgi:cysteine desulfurase / selenocysteine lyase